MSGPVVHKFSDACLTGSEALVRAASVVAQAAGEHPVIAVVASLAGMPDSLAEAADRAASGDRDGALHDLAAVLDRHETVLEALGDDGEEPVRADLNAIVGELRDLVRGSVLLGEITLRARDRIRAAGEKMSARLLAHALRRGGLRAQALDADDFLETDGGFGEANPLGDVAGRTISAAVRPHLDAGVIPVVTGHIGRAPDGATTTLGRGGADLTACLVAGALEASEVVVWTDVRGVFTASPVLVPEARVVEKLNYREATELAYYGIDALHLRSIVPIRRLGTPVRIRSLKDLDCAGTLVTARFTASPSPVKGVAAAPGQCLVSVEGSGAEDATSVSSRVLHTLARAGIRVTMISQSSSEASICLAVPMASAKDSENVLKREFRTELTTGAIDDISFRADVALVAAIGLGMRDTPGVAARLFAALGSRRVNVIACAQGSSQFNVTMAVDAGDMAAAVRALHEDFGLAEGAGGWRA